MMLHVNLVYSSKSGSKTAFETPGVWVQLTFLTTHTHTHTHAWLGYPGFRPLKSPCCLSEA